MSDAPLAGYARADGRKGVRNALVVVYLVECAHHVARAIASAFEDREVHLIGFPGCYPNDYALGMLEKLGTHPNVGAALLVSLGCEGMDKLRLKRTIAASGRPVELLGIQPTGGTAKTIAAGRAWVAATLPTVTKKFTGLIKSHTHIDTWMKHVGDRPAVQRGMNVPPTH